VACTDCSCGRRDRGHGRRRGCSIRAIPGRGRHAQRRFAGRRSALGGDDQTGLLFSQINQSGTLGYANPETVYGLLSGTITWLPSVGQVIEPGQTLYKVDNQPVVLFKGNVPAYRDMSSEASFVGGAVLLATRPTGCSASGRSIGLGDWDVGCCATPRQRRCHRGVSGACRRE
jgi:hypothetical protein